MAVSTIKRIMATDIGNSVTGVKGDREVGYRIGNVNLTAGNIGAFGSGSLGSITDMNNNTLYGSAFVSTANVTNLPTTGSQTGDDYYYVACFGGLQLAIYHGGAGGLTKLYKREYTNSKWYPWTSATPADVGAVSKSGDTMTGNLRFNGATVMRQTNADYSTPPDSPVSSPLVQALDVNNIIRHQVYADLSTGGNYYTILHVRDGQGKATSIGVGLDQSGNSLYTVSHPAKFREALSTYSKSETDSLIGHKMYSARGAIIKSDSTGTSVGYGKATVSIIGKTVIVDFEAHITTAGTLTNIYDIGIQVANLRAINSNIPAFTVSHGGNIHYYNSDGTLNTTLEGYGGEATFVVDRNRWSFGRMYTTGGDVGAWSDSRYSVGLRIVGTVYGKAN